MHLQLVQSIPTTGASSVCTFKIEDVTYLAISQKAKDVPDSAACIEGGDSNVPCIIFRYEQESFHKHQELEIAGSVSTEFFTINERNFLAVASHKSGKGPYSYDQDSMIYEWINDGFVPFQGFPTFAARKWHYFEVQERYFLALAQGLISKNIKPMHPSRSAIYEWKRDEFVKLQDLPFSEEGYSWTSFSIEDEHFLAFVDGSAFTMILLWDGQQFKSSQLIERAAGRSLEHFQHDENHYLIFVRDALDTVVYKWCKIKKEFLVYEMINGARGCALALHKEKKYIWLFLVNSATGEDTESKVRSSSALYRLHKDSFLFREEISTLGGTDATFFLIGDRTYVVVSRNLSKDFRFKTDTHIYRFDKIVRKIETYHSPEFLDLFSTMFDGPQSIRSDSTQITIRAMAARPLIVATKSEILVFPSPNHHLEEEHIYLSQKGHKELESIYNLKLILSLLITIYELNRLDDGWRKRAELLLHSISKLKGSMTKEFWRGEMYVKAFQGHNESISSLMVYALSVSLDYVKIVMSDPTKLTMAFFREALIEGTSKELKTIISFDKIMSIVKSIAGFDIAHQTIEWLKTTSVDWRQSMILIYDDHGIDSMVGGIREPTEVCNIPKIIFETLVIMSEGQLRPQSISFTSSPSPITVGDVDDPAVMIDLEHCMRSLWCSTYAHCSSKDIKCGQQPGYLLNTPLTFQVDTREKETRLQVSNDEADITAENVMEGLALSEANPTQPSQVFDDTDDTIDIIHQLVSNNNDPSRVVLDKLNYWMHVQAQAQAPDTDELV